MEGKDGGQRLGKGTNYVIGSVPSTSSGAGWCQIAKAFMEYMRLDRAFEGRERWHYCVCVMSGSLKHGT